MNYQTALEQIKGYEPHFEDYNYVDLLSIKSKLRIANNYLYYGQLFNNLKHGRGILLSSNGRRYEGHWNEDEKNGYGWELLPNGSQYEGYYFHGKPHGKGKFIWANGEYYVGEWNMGIREGQGIWCGLNGEYYSGQWKTNQATGFGEYIQNGNKYMGNFLQWMKNGEGQEFFNNGDKYQGNYLNGMPHGYGEYIWSSGALFQGYFKEGLRYGKGIWRRSEESPTDSYQGHYEEDKKNGFGVYKWANGNVYKGQFMNDFKHGYGEMIYFDGQVIKGNWEQGRLVNQIRTQSVEKIKNDNNYQIKIVDEINQVAINTNENRIVLKISEVAKQSNIQYTSNRKEKVNFLYPSIYENKKQSINSNPSTQQTNRTKKLISIKQYTKERQLSQSQECAKAFKPAQQIELTERSKIQSKFCIKATEKQNLQIRKTKLSQSLIN
ncbi:unnamed protein product (macronuclear) [Paramecium tetraurelia]|uniref:MORN repeat protein n=1 Tax=Paramecium tetraurelia TaxID=5888 RepID=A0CE05_PARTE|nr:uncharacterized protein GSPATT00007234001 [Paramecium tetraurelia]CAK69022.1 unnamed protein product [Paramecium tetraurelia]|eukprot:XP_001436419.1 hypothetical protein (macronuclear) [Paramecium tetraurelia strain d4-2]